MEQFTFLDWIIAGSILALGLIGAAVKVFYYDDPEINEYHKTKKSKR